MPLDPKLTKFSTASPTITTFSFEDIASGLNFISFLGMASEDGSAVSYHLVTNSSLWSDPVGTTREGTGTTEMNFDTSTFNRPRTPRGTAFFSAGMACDAGETAKITVQLIHVDSGDTETTISAEITTATKASTSPTGVMYAVPIPITTNKRFVKGDKLRLEVKMIKVSGANTAAIGHDPANQTIVTGEFDPANGATTTMRLEMPFEAEI